MYILILTELLNKYMALTREKVGNDKKMERK